jgi:hypothetical protein
LDRQPAVHLVEDELEATSLVSTLAAVGIAAAAVSLAALPAAIALRVVSLPAGGVGAALGCLGAAVFGVKLIAMAWATGARLFGAPSALGAVAPVD